ncbi:MAG: hypothetical protein FWC40_06915 [Proteobacteria bacterium]|nr:hypothetical protein [Pseudomonadota bacterium]
MTPNHNPQENQDHTSLLRAALKRGIVVSLIGLAIASAAGAYIKDTSFGLHIAVTGMISLAIHSGHMLFLERLMLSMSGVAKRNEILDASPGITLRIHLLMFAKFLSLGGVLVLLILVARFEAFAVAAAVFVVSLLNTFTSLSIRTSVLPKDPPGNVPPEDPTANQTPDQG